MPIRFSWNGQPVEARPGDSIAAALNAAGVGLFGTSRSGRKRGLFCGMGVCQECLVIVDGQRSRRACMTEVAPGLVVLAQDDRTASPAAAIKAHRSLAPLAVDLAIIGAGPAGLNAAILAAKAGARACVLDERDEPGGQYFKPRSSGFRGAGAEDAQHRRGRALRDQARDSGVEIHSGVTVWFARADADGNGFRLRIDGPDGQRQIATRTVILATGALERPAMVPGWTLPGVMTIGAAQTLARRYGVVPRKRLLIAGHGPLGMQLAVELRKLGAHVVAVAERAKPRPGTAMLRAAASAPRLVGQGLDYRLRLLRDRVPLLAGWEVAEVTGMEKAEGAILRRLSDGAIRQIAADTICIGDGFLPQIELARLMGVQTDLDPDTATARPRRDATGATGVPGLWIAGDAGGLGGAQLAEVQGRLAAAGALRHLGFNAPDDAASQGRAAKARQFQDSLWQIYSAPPRTLPGDPVTICRCEEVTAGQVRAAIANGATDPGAIKRATRLGMGRCQGRYCSAPAMRLLAAAGYPLSPDALFAPQIPARPVHIAALALEKPEWSGHVESRPSARPGLPAQEPLKKTTADLVVIGGGVTGISAALYAARGGADVLCLDRGLVNGEASGGNAGSLHLQLLSWDFGVKSVSGGSPQLLTLPLQKESIALWTTLAGELGTSFEMKITGGMMVAENTDQIGFLERKVAAEARFGIASEVIGPDRIRQIAPSLNPNIVAAAWCAGEGKINPLVGTIALARAARTAGARIEERTPVTGLRANGGEYEIQTPRGNIRTRRILIAAGGWSAGVSRLIGVDLPIRGAPLQMLVTETAPPLVPCLIAHADRHLTMKQTDAGTILIGGAWTAQTGPSGQPQVLANSVEGNLWVAAHTVPALAGLSVIRSWAAMNIDIDGAPLLGPIPGLPGVFVAATANGYTLGPVMGREAAAMALSGKARADLAVFSIDRFQKVTPGAQT